jgi:hypothetical protein
LVTEYLKKPMLPNNLKATLIEACVTGNEEVVAKILGEFQINVEDITGKME